MSYLRSPRLSGSRTLPDISSSYSTDNISFGRPRSRVNFSNDPVINEILHENSPNSSLNSRFIDLKLHSFKRPFSAHNSNVDGNNKQLLLELKNEIHMYKEELKNKEKVISSLMQSNRPNGFTREWATISKEESIVGENAALKLKVDNLTAQLSEAAANAESQEKIIEELRREIDSLHENEARLIAMTDSLKSKYIQLNEHTGEMGLFADRSESTIKSLQRTNLDSKTQIEDLKKRLSVKLEAQEEAEQKCQVAESKYSELLAQLGRIMPLYLEADITELEPEQIMEKITTIIQDNALAKGQSVAFQETIDGLKQENRASKETIQRLIEEITREQKNGHKFTLEVENFRVERDAAVTAKEDAEKEIERLRERLLSSQRAWELTRQELERQEQKVSNLDIETRETIYGAQNAERSFQNFREEISVLLSDVLLGTVTSSDIDIKDSIRKIKVMLTENRLKIEELVNQNDALQRRCPSPTRLMELEDLRTKLQQSEAHSQHLEADRDKLTIKLHQLEANLSSSDALRNGASLDRHRYHSCLEKIAAAMQMNRLVVSPRSPRKSPRFSQSLELTCDALVKRAHDLVNCEREVTKFSDTSDIITSLQAKIHSYKEQIADKDLHLDLMRNKLADFEAKLAAYDTIAVDRDNEQVKIERLEQLVTKLRHQLDDAKIETRHYRSKMTDADELKHISSEQQQEIDNLVCEIGELEKIRERQSRKIAGLKNEIKSDSATLDNDVVIQGLSNDLRLMRNKLQDVIARERELMEFRKVICSLLGLQTVFSNSDIYKKLEYLKKEISHFKSSQTWLDPMDENFKKGYTKQDRVLTSSSYQRKSPRARKRTKTPVKVDTRSY